MTKEKEEEKSKPRPVEVQRTKKAEKMYGKLPAKVVPIVDLLETDLRETAGKPYDRGWKSLGELTLDTGEKAMHCHLNLHYVAIWCIEILLEKIVCKFTYLGSREKVPY